ncbi:MAG: PaaI family thioesterase [Myxococcota bacterium]|jgi:acyl-coenzyme A thioesterase PaaI-like protein|nr:PaaI family thioesterase [Myxococcota bacterium]
MPDRAFQEYYPAPFDRCYGCGTANEQGLHVLSRWDGEESVCTYTPGPQHLAVPGVVYGGLIASLIDCHSTGTAAAAAYRAEGRALDTLPALRFVTASLHVDYLAPTPLGIPLELRSTVREIKGRKVVVGTTLTAAGVVCARGEVVAVRIPDDFIPPRP